MRRRSSDVSDYGEENENERSAVSDYGEENENERSAVYDYGEEKENERSMEGEHKHRWDYLCEGLAQKTRCGKCGFFIPEHQGCYACCGCSYAEAVHKTCADLPRRISRHPLHAIHTLILQQSPHFRSGAECYYCREALRGGPEDPYYTCQSCETDEDEFDFLSMQTYLMHAACALIPLPVVCGEREYVCHQRRMLLLEEGAAEETTCFSCGSQWWGGRAYRCTAAPLCRNFFHGSCAELPPRIRFARHDHDRGLELAVGRPETCWACGRRGCRHVYYCKFRDTPEQFDETGCRAFVLGAECVFHSSCLVRTSHKHGLSLVEDRPAGALRCDACRGIFHGGAVPAEVRRTADVSFRCQDCAFNLHFLCGPLPSVVNFDYHIHPLHLVNLLVEDDSGEYYCDVCEEERDLRFRVYHCADCKFVAHIHCLVSQIMKLLKEESNTNVEFMILGESSLNGSTKTDRESTAQESTLGQDNPTEELFFGDIVHRLTEEEKAKLDFYTLDSATDHKIIRSRGSRFIVSLLDRNKGPKTEHVDFVEEYFHLGSTEFSELCSEFSRLKPEKLVLEMDNKYESMKVIDVGGYMVPWALASDLKMLLQKYGDLGGDSSLTQQMKSFTATLLCATVNRMRNTMAEDMSIDDLKYWYYNLNLVKKIAGYKVKELECFEESVMTTFLGFKAIRFEKEANESLDLKIAKLKAELEDCEGKREKLKCASTKSDFMKECLRKASGSKWKTVDKLF